MPQINDVPGFIAQQIGDYEHIRETLYEIENGMAAIAEHDVLLAMRLFVDRRIEEMKQ
jgi:hypothetical protein